MNRREMLAGLLALPIIPSFLKRKKGNPLRQKKYWLPKNCVNKKIQVAAVTETGTIALRVTDHTELQTTAECTTPCTITQVVFHVQDMLHCMLPEGSTIVIRKGDVLVVEINHHYESRAWKQPYRTYPRENPTATFVLARQDAKDEMMKTKDKDKEDFPGGWVPPPVFYWRNDEENVLRYYYALCDRPPQIWYVAGLHHWRHLHDEKPLELSLYRPFLA